MISVHFRRGDCHSTSLSSVCIVFFQRLVFKSSSIRSTLSCWAVGKDYKEIFYFCQQGPHQMVWNLSPVCAQLLGKSQTSHFANWCSSSWYITSYWISLFQSLWRKVQINGARFVSLPTEFTHWFVQIPVGCLESGCAMFTQRKSWRDQ